MLDFIKNFIKTNPMAYDFINRFRPINDPVDCWLNDFSILNNKKIKFIQVGANDGLRWDHIRRFVVRDKWSGVFVEPVFPVFTILKKNYEYLKRSNLYFENCLISSKSGFVDFYTYSDSFLHSLPIEKKMFYYRKSSMDRSALKQNLSGFLDDNNQIDCHKTPSKKLEAIWEKYFKNGVVDLVFIDAEGHDDEVIYSIDFDKRLPRSIVYESHNLGSRQETLKDFLASHNYTLLPLGGDTVAYLK